MVTGRGGRGSPHPLTQVGPQNPSFQGHLSHRGVGCPLPSRARQPAATAELASMIPPPPPDGKNQPVESYKNPQHRAPSSSPQLYSCSMAPAGKIAHRTYLLRGPASLWK